MSLAGKRRRSYLLWQSYAFAFQVGSRSLVGRRHDSGAITVKDRRGKNWIQDGVARKYKVYLVVGCFHSMVPSIPTILRSRGIS